MFAIPAVVGTAAAAVAPLLGSAVAGAQGAAAWVFPGATMGWPAASLALMELSQMAAALTPLLKTGAKVSESTIAGAGRALSAALSGALKLLPAMPSPPPDNGVPLSELDSKDPLAVALKATGYALSKPQLQLWLYFASACGLLAPEWKTGITKLYGEKQAQEFAARSAATQKRAHANGKTAEHWKAKSDAKLNGAAFPSIAWLRAWHDSVMSVQTAFVCSVAGAAVGAAAAAAAPMLAGLALGITSLGPISGGLFALFQSWGLVTAGSTLSAVQSAVMTGVIASSTWYLLWIVVGAATAALLWRNLNRGGEKSGESSAVTPTTAASLLPSKL